MNRNPVTALWRPSSRQDWQSVDLLAVHQSGQLVVRETGRFWPGIFLASTDQVRVAGPVFEVR